MRSCHPERSEGSVQFILISTSYDQLQRSFASLRMTVARFYCRPRPTFIIFPLSYRQVIMDSLLSIVKGRFSLHLGGVGRSSWPAITSLQGSPSATVRQIV
ncbi:hypothetical protein SBA2_10053 [Acidobacteriia bacterium SbA2]|nr:hypothetical protein SBA2_10053 [Acidobacteriia bacterium SbA2]